MNINIYFTMNQCRPMYKSYVLAYACILMYRKGNGEQRGPATEPSAGATG